MDKRALSRIQRPELTPQQAAAPQLMPGMNYLVTAQREEVSGADTLAVNFFIRASEGGLAPHFRIFLQQGDFISQDLTQEKIRWKTGGVDYLTDTHWWRSRPTFIKVDTMADHDTVTAWFRENAGNMLGSFPEADRNEDAVDLIERYCNSVKEDRLRRRHDKEKAVIDEQMQRFGDLPDDYQDFVEHDVFDQENFFFYSRKKHFAYCTRCGKSYELKGDRIYHGGIEVTTRFNPKDLKHNGVVHCPFCDGFVTARSDGIPRGQLLFVAWSVLIQKDGEDVLVRYFRHIKDLREDYRAPKYVTFEAFRTVHTAEKYMDYMWGRWKNTQEYRWTDFHMQSSWYWNNAGWNYPNTTMFYEKNYEQELPGTCMQYCCLKDFIHRVIRRDNSLNSPWAIDKYFNSFRKHPYIEQLIKVGMYRLVQDVLERPDYANGLHLKTERTICESLGISRNQYKMLRKVARPTLDDLKVLKDVGEIPFEDYQFLCSKEKLNSNYRRYIDMMRHTTIGKIRRYMEKQGIKHDSDYLDYLGWIEEMGYDMRSNFNLFPGRFLDVHDQKMEEYQHFRSERAKEEARIFNEMMAKAREQMQEDDPARMEYSGLFIRPPYRLEELKQEGEVLHHCVATYTERVAKGETMIFFIRKIEAPDMPYFTLEWKHGRIIQCRGMRNCDMTPAVKTFTCIFAEKMQEYEREQMKQRKEG